ncbi:MAG: ureidoglycolate lyase [Gammaproteobacteria bacterium]|nr:ureidoglycolate lyase [Gammaproteobacteria bacterium]
MSSKTISVSKLNAENFSEFGDVIETGGEAIEINQGTTLRFNDLAQLDLLEHGGRPSVSIFRAKPLALPFSIRLLERHSLSSQAFFPIDNRSYLVIVAPPAEKLEHAKIKAFIAHGRQGVNYHRGTWHHPLLALDEESEFIVIDRAADDKNCDEYWFSDSEIRTVDINSGV